MLKYLFSIAGITLLSMLQLAYGQCTILPTAVPGPTLVCTGGTSFRSGVAYNPNRDLLYSVNSGSANYQVETFDSQGNPLNSTAQGFDYRGLWWNSNLNALEGNGYGSNGIFVADLAGATGYPTGTGTVIFSGQNQPFQHSCGQYDPVNNTILYYYDGSIYVYDRATATQSTVIPVTGLPVPTSNLNTTSIAYTGCSGSEVALHDYVTSSVYFINLATGAYVATSQLPVNAPTPTNQRMSYANDLIWLFDEVNYTWHSYQILEPCPESYATLSPTVCDTYTSPSGNHIWETSGVYQDTLTNAAGCDSIITINLTVNESTTTTLNITACNSYTVPSGANTYTSSGSYADVLTTTGGCDSVLVINLTIETLPVEITQDVDTLFASPGGSSYQWLDCDLGYAPISGQVGPAMTLTTSGNYAVVIGNGNCVDTSSCVTAYHSNIQDGPFGSGLNLYPNPTSGQFTLDLGTSFPSVSVRIFTMLGEQIYFHEYETLQKVELELPGTSGVYLVDVQSKSGEHTSIKVLKD